MKQSITQKMLSKVRYLLLICILLLSTLNGFADHLRFGHITWTRVSGSPMSIKFTVRHAFRLGQFPTATLGGTISSGNLRCGDGTNISLVYTVTAINQKDDWIFCEFNTIKTYTAPGNYKAFYNACCRIIPLQNNSNGLPEISTMVQVGPGFNDIANDAPIAVTAPIVNFPREKAFVSLKIPAVDPNGDVVTFSLTPAGEFGTPSVQPVGMSVSNDGWLSWNTIGKTVGQFYNTSVRMSDGRGAYTTVDFLIKIVDSSQPPSFDYVSSPADGTVFNLQPGQPITFNIKVLDPSTGDTVVLSALGMPPGATFTTSGTNPVNGTFGWVPTPAQQGTYIVLFVSQDKAGVQNTTTISFNVGYKPFFNIPTTPGNNSVFSRKPGDTIAHEVKAITLDTTSTSRLSLTVASGLRAGMTFTPAMPLTPAKPITTNFKWVPQASDWGLNTVVYKTEDTFRRQPVYDTIHYIIDNPPVITSTPDTNATVGSLYTYTLSATDLDLPLGDKLKVENITLPSFLSIVANNNNTWTISGTPGAGHVGVHNITIEVADSMNHKFGSHDGNAYQYIPLHVNVGPLAASGTVSHVTIFGGNNGSVNLTPTGGVAPYTYSWSNSATSEDISGLTAGTYTVTVTDANSATVTKTFTVNQPAQLTVLGVPSNVTINGGNNGSINITPAGGVGPYTYVWSNSTTSEDPNGLIAGTYTVTVTDANGATATGSYTVAQPAQLVVSGIATDVTINGGNNGSINITVSGGVGPYSYAWSNSTTYEDPSGLIAATYNVTVTDANGATATGSYTVGQPAQLTVSGVVSDVTIFGSNNGAINITPVGGVGPYTYAWSNSTTSEDPSSLIAGTYSVTVTDANGATATGSYTVGQPAQLTATGITSPVLINGGSSGSINITPAGGVGPYSYVWSNNATTEDLSNVPAGSYTVTITDANGAVFTATYTVSQPAVLTVSGVVADVTIFGGNNGSINITPAGGVGPYTYNWGGGNVSEDRTTLLAGTYNVTVTDANGATATGSYTVNQPAQLTVSGVVSNVTIFGNNNGSINITPAGGVGPYTYAWSNSTTSEDATGLIAGAYNVVVTDANGATASGSFTVTQPAQLTVSGIATNATIYNTNTGSINITPAGGVGPYTYNWGGGVTTEDRTALAAGTYNVTVTDANGATATGSYTVGQPAQLTATATTTPVLINGGSTGTINITPAGGVGPYAYLWSNNATTEDLLAVAAGSYTVTITDANGATFTATYTVTQPAPLTISGVTNNVSVFNGNNGGVNITPAGGVGPYTYNWGGGILTEDLTGIIAGIYTVTVTDVNGATATATYTILQPLQLSVTGIVSNVTIFGLNNGSINITPAGGVGPYTYIWSNLTFNEDPTGLSAGSYLVTVKDANLAVAVATFTVTQPAQLAVTGTVSNVTIFNANNGSINITPAGGVGPYTYAWSNSTTNEDPTGLTAGSYTVVVTDANGATKTATYTVTQPAQLTATSVVTPVAIYNGNTGSINITPAGGVGPYTYNWGGGIVTEDRTGLTAGTYTVTITDANGAIFTATYTVSQPAQLTVSGVVSNVTIFNGNNGAVNITPAGGVGPYTYVWNNNSTNEDRTGLTAGTYSVTVTDANGATATGTYTVSQPTQLTVAGVVSNVTIFNGNNGAINITPAGGVGPYTYIWNNNSTNEDRTSLVAGTYTVTVKDANNATATGTYTVSQPAQLAVSGVVSNVTIFNGNNGAINITPAGGVGPYTYVWNNNSINEDRTGLVAGTYSVTVTDANGATATGSYTVSQPAQLTVSGVVSNVTIFNGNNGAVNITPAGGVGPYTYVWNNNSTNEDRTGLTAGTYSVTVTDANGATATATFTVTQPTQLTATAVVTPVAIYNGNTGSINITVTGGVGPYTYNWGGNVTTEDRTGLTAGTYTVTVTDANGATFTATYTVTQPTQLTVTGIVSNVTVYNGSNGAINITAAGGVGPYTYVWNNNSVLEDRTGLVAGTYSVIVKDANNATATATFTVTQPNASLTVTGTVTNTTCNGGNNGAVNITVAGGTAPFTYVWSTGATTQNITGRTAGTYTVTVKDATNATGTATFTVGQPAPIVLSGALTHVSCNGGDNGSIDLSVSGGTGPYTYSWNLGGSNTNNNNCYNWWWWWCSNNCNNNNNNTTTQDVNDLSEGNYSVTVTDNKGCTVTGNYTITEPTAISITAAKTNVTCKDGNNGTITLTVNGGTPPYSYNWTTGSSWCSNNSNVTTQNRSGLDAGTYTVKVTDAKGCTKTLSVNITEPSTGLTASATTTNINCKGSSTGAINLSVSGGASPYSYNWTGGATTQDITNKAAGTYTVVITDANNCSVSKTYTITEPSTALALNALTANVSCYGEDNGSINLSVTGGTSPYTYKWNNNATCQDRTDLIAGTYSITVTDNKGCTATGSYTITQPTAITVSATKTNVTCKGGNNGTITLAVSGGTAPYTYNWYNGSSWCSNNNNVTTQNRSGLEDGTYTVKVTDAKGCTKTLSVSITEPTSGITASTTVTNVTCKNSSTGSINLTVSGGTSPYSYSWTGGATTQDISNRAAGTYTVTVTDANGCSVSKSATITEPSTALSLTSTTTNVTCYNEDNGAINLSVSGGTSPYTYKWNNNATCQDRTDLTAGTYSVVVTDSKGCTVTGSYTITQPTSGISVSGVVTHVSCNNGTNGAINISVSGGSSPYSYNWYNGSSWCSNNNNSSSQNRSNLDAGNYTVKVTDNKGCTKTMTFTVNEPTSISGSIFGSTLIYKGYGSQSVTLTTSASGGNGGYTYQWTPSSSVSNATAASTSVSPSSTTTYSCKITDSKGCIKTITKTVTVEDVRCGSNNDKVVMCKNNNQVCVSQSQVNSYLNNGYQVGECSNGCKTTEPTEEGVNTIVAQDIKVYPNPSNGIFLMELPAGVMNADVLVTDIAGRMIEHRTAIGVNSIRFDLSKVPAGTYLLNVTSGKNFYQSKVTIQ